MNIGKQIIVMVTLLLAMRVSWTYADYNTAESYLQHCKFTQEQTKYVLKKSNSVKDKDHYIKWIGAISAHEQGETFVEGKTKFFAGRLAKDMKYKDFETQVDGWTNSYNKYWYKNNTAKDWINRSKYCVSDTHGGGEGCPNWVRNVPAIASLYKPNKHIIDEYREPLKRNIADKAPIPIAGSKRCKIIMNAPADGYIQIDSIAGKFISRLKNIRKSDKIFFCRNI